MTDNDALARPSWWRGLVFEVCMAVLVLIWGPFCMLTAPFPYRWRYWFISRWSFMVLALLRWICGIRLAVEGVENIPGEAGVVFCKHQSTIETLALQHWFSPQTWVLKRELTYVPIFGWALGLLAPIAINRGAGRNAVEQVVSQGRERLRQGRWVVVFPEGTRTPPGHRGRYRIGGAILASETGATVVPVAHNAGEHWPRQSVAKRPGVVRFRIGEPIDAGGRDAAEVGAEAEAWIEAQMPELYQGDYPGTRYEKSFKG